MRKQYHSRILDGHCLIWDIDRLVDLSRTIPIVDLPLAQINELDEGYWFSAQEKVPTCRMIIEHMRLITAADLAYPIILAPDGRLMDGMHRVAQAAMRGFPTIQARRFSVLPTPDYVDVPEGSLPYD